jgi:hypothetical protein
MLANLAALDDRHRPDSVIATVEPNVSGHTLIGQTNTQHRSSGAEQQPRPLRLKSRRSWLGLKTISNVTQRSENSTTYYAAAKRTHKSI